MLRFFTVGRCFLHSLKSTVDKERKKMEYHLDGRVEPLANTSGVFRKHTTSAAELYVAQLLYNEGNPCEHIVRVLGVTSSYYDAELLIVSDNPMWNSDAWGTEACRTALSEAKRWLHSHGIVYFDWHGGNVGMSATTGTIKLFDFDSVGVLHDAVTGSWRMEPDQRMWSWRTYKDRYFHPCNVDDYIFSLRVLNVKETEQKQRLKWGLLAACAVIGFCTGCLASTFSC